MVVLLQACQTNFLLLARLSVFCPNAERPLQFLWAKKKHQLQLTRLKQRHYLCVCVFQGQLEIVALLHFLELKVDNVDSYGQTPLHLAALRGNYSVVEYLVMDCDANIG